MHTHTPQFCDRSRGRGSSPCSIEEPPGMSRMVMESGESCASSKPTRAPRWHARTCAHSAAATVLCIPHSGQRRPFVWTAATIVSDESVRAVDRDCGGGSGGGGPLDGRSVPRVSWNCTARWEWRGCGDGAR